MSTILDSQLLGTATTRDREHAAAAHLTPRSEPDLRAVPSHQTLAVVCALVFFGPLGIAAVVSAGHVRTRLALGDLAGARRASRRTLWLCCWSAAATVFFVLVIALGAGSYSDVH